MTQPKTAVLVGAVIILAFVAGYKGDTLAEYISLERIRALFTAASGAVFKSSDTVSGSTSGGATSLAPADNLPATGMIPPPPGMGAPFGMSSSIPPSYPGVGNPFSFSSLPARNPSSVTITNTPSGDGGVPRNAYFDKLSEQMRELRQQNMVQTFSVPSEPAPQAPVFSSAPGFPPAEPIPLENPSQPGLSNPGEMPPPEMQPGMMFPEESEDLDNPELLSPEIIE